MRIMVLVQRHSDPFEIIVGLLEDQTPTHNRDNVYNKDNTANGKNAKDQYENPVFSDRRLHALLHSSMGTVNAVPQNLAIRSFCVPL